MELEDLLVYTVLINDSIWMCISKLKSTLIMCISFHDDAFEKVFAVSIKEEVMVVL